MNSLRTIAITFALGFSMLTAAAEPSAAHAAKKYYPAATWQNSSVLMGNFSCRGKQDLAILGTSENEIVVAIFLHGLSRKPELLRYSASLRSPESAVLSAEDLDFRVEDFEREIGPLPRGLQPSKTCMGLNMSDQLIDSAHIFWNRRSGRFEDWVR